jgi:hypothetical protein
VSLKDYYDFKESVEQDSSDLCAKVDANSENVQQVIDQVNQMFENVESTYLNAESFEQFKEHINEQFVLID